MRAVCLLLLTADHRGGPGLPKEVLLSSCMRERERWGWGEREREREVQRGEKARIQSILMVGIGMLLDFTSSLF